ncbi:MAG: hypothetical protein IPK67_08110 [Planctomycetes bacterium]|nr:hypothetical protein [Planctomycetota bacterium]
MLSLVFAQVLVVTGASLVTGTPGAPGAGTAAPDPRPVTLVVEAGKVREILPAGSAPAGLPAEARVLDGTGLFLCAAPLDGFAYWDEAHDPLYASAGVALVADHGNRVLSIFDARANSARVGYPDLRICGPVIDGFPPSTTDASVARTPLEAEAQLRPLLEEGIDFVAFQANLTAEPWRKLLEVAHGASRQVWGPRPRGLTLAEAVAGGQDGFLMMDVLLEPGTTWEGRRAEDFDAGIQKLGAARARLVPLLSGNARLLERWTAELPELENLSPEFASYWRSEVSARSTLFADPAARAEFQAKGAKAMELQRELLLRLHRAGVRLVPGSGAPHPWLFPGRGLHDELALWQAAGLAPAVLVHLATAGAAEALGVAELRGSLSRESGPISCCCGKTPA